MAPYGLKHLDSQWRDFGTMQAFGRTLADLRLIAKYNTLDFYFLELPSFSPVIEKATALPNLTVREIRSQEWQHLRFEEGLATPEWIEQQFAQNSRLFLALDGDTVLMNWINTKFADLKHIGRPKVALPEGTAYAYRAVTAPAYRNQGIGTFLKQSILKQIQPEGHQIVFLTVFLKDIRPHRWHQANHFKKWGRVTYINLRIKQLWWIRLTKEGRRCPELFHA